MSRKLVTTIKDNPRLPGKHKRVLEAYAAFANNDGSNIFPSKDKVAKKASISRSAVYHNTEDLLRVKILVPAASHTCKVEACNKGATHFWGQQGKYTAVYNINLPVLENDHTYLLLNQLKVDVPKQLNLFVQNQLKVGVQKQLKDGVLKLDTTQALPPTPASLGKTLDSAALGKELYSSASHEAGIDLPTDQYCVLSENDEAKSSNPSDLQADEVQSSEANQEKDNGNTKPEEESGFDLPSFGWMSTKEMLEHLYKCYPSLKHNLRAVTETEIEQFIAIIRKCDNNCCYPEDVLGWAKTHMPPGKLQGNLRSIRGFHNTICGKDISSTNGLMAQFKEHVNPKDCHICLKKVQGVNCKSPGCKSWVELNLDGTAGEYCPGCVKKVPQYRRESGRRNILTSSI